MVAYTIHFAELATFKRRESDCLWRNPDAGLAPPTDPIMTQELEKANQCQKNFEKVSVVVWAGSKKGLAPKEIDVKMQFAANTTSGTNEKGGNKITELEIR